MFSLQALKPLWPDLLAMLVSVFLALCFHFFIGHRRAVCPLHTMQGLARFSRRKWVAGIIRNHSGILAVQTLRNSTMVASFMASTCCLLALGVLSMAATETGNGGGWRILHLLGVHQPDMIAVKVLALLLLLFFAFYCFAASIRLYSHVSFMLGTIADSDEELAPLGHASTQCLDKAAREFHMGMRAFYYMVPLVLWLFGPLFMVAGMIGILVVLYRIDYMPSSLTQEGIDIPCHEDEACQSPHE